MVKSQIAQTREMICDGMATRKLIDSQTYAQSLLRLVTRIPFTAVVSISNAIGIFDADILEKRILMMRTKGQQLSLTLRYCLMIAGALFLFSVAGGGGLVARAIEAQNPDAAAGSDSTRKGHHKDLSCTYYDAQNAGHPGTCGTKKGSKKTYYCFLNDDKRVSELQIGCEAKLAK
jgi:hypothetical protein